MTNKIAVKPDNLTTVTVTINFNSKPISVPLSGILESSYCMPCDDDAAEYLEKLARTIRKRKLYQFLQSEAPDDIRKLDARTQEQRAAEALASGAWVAMSTEEIVANAEEMPALIHVYRIRTAEEEAEKHPHMRLAGGTDVRDKPTK